MSAIPATLSDVIRSVVALLIAVGDVAAANDGSGGTARVFHGEEYAGQSDTPPRYVFVQSAEGGDIGPALATSARQVAGITETVTVSIWGAGPSDDARTDDAKARAQRIINAFKASAPGRLKGKVFTRESSPRILKFGEEYAVRYAYTWAVQEDEAIWAAAYAANPSPIAPPRVDKPDGDTGLSFGVTSATHTDTRP